MSDFRDDEFGEVEPIDDGFGKVEPIKAENDEFGDVEPVEAEEYPIKSEKPSDEKKDEKPSIPDIPRGFFPTIDMANDVAEEAQRRAAEEPKFKTRKEHKYRMVPGSHASTYGMAPQFEWYDADTVDEITDTNGNVAKRGEIVEVNDGKPITGASDGRRSKRRLYEFVGDDEKGHPTLRRLTEDEAKGKTAKASMSGDVFRRMRGDGRIKMDSSALEQVRQGVLAETGNVDMYGEGVMGQLEAVAARAMPYVGRAFVSKYKRELSALYDLSQGNVGSRIEDWWDKISEVSSSGRNVDGKWVENDHGLTFGKRDRESDEQYKARISKAAGDELRRRIEAMQEASADLGATEKDAVEKIIGGFIDSSGYALEFAVPGGTIGKAAKGISLLKGSGWLAKLGNGLVREAVVTAPVVASEAGSRYTDMTTPGFALDWDGNPYIRDAAEDKGTAAWKAITGAIADTAAEVGTEGAVKGLFRLGLKPAGWAFGKLTPDVMAKVERGYGKFVNSKPGRLLSDFSKAYDEFTDVTGINRPWWEQAEENVQAFESVLGISGEKSSERARKLREGGFASEWEAFKDEQMSLGTQTDIFLGLIGQLAFGAATSAYNAHQYRKSDAYENEQQARRDLVGALRLANVSEDTINSLSDKQMHTLDRMWRHYSANPDELMSKAKNLSLGMRAAVREMAERKGARFAGSLEAEGIAPEKFVFQGDENGKPVFRHILRVHGDNSTEQMDAMSDSQHGVTIVDTHDGKFAVMNNWRGSVPTVCNSFDEAHTVADGMALENQRKDVDNNKKLEYFKNYVAPNYGNRNMHTVNTIAQLREQVAEDIANNPNGFFGIKAPSAIFDEKGDLHEQKAGGFHTADGTTVLILDNIVSPADMERVAAHEAIGHEGMENQVGRENIVEFIGGTRAQGFSEFAYGKFREIAQNLIDNGYSVAEALQMAADVCDSDRGRKEIMAKYAEQRRHMPTARQMKQREENEKRRAAGETVAPDDADIEYMLWQSEQEAAKKNSDKKHTQGRAVVQEFETPEGAEAPQENAENAPASVPDEEGTTSQPEAEKPTEGEGGASGEAQTEEQPQQTETAVSQDNTENAPKPTENAEETAESVEDEQKNGTSSTTEEQSTQTVVGRNDKQIETVEVPVAELTLSKDVPQFKEGGNENGVVEPLEASRYERRGTAPIVVWERTDGRKEVITGRHRLDLARRLGENTIPAQIVREADGFTKEMAMALDAESNIRDGQGSIKDYENYFRNSKIDEVEASGRGLLARDKGRKGFAIARWASPDVVAAFHGGELSPEKAAAIATEGKGDEALQNVGLKFAKGHTVAETVSRMKNIKGLAQSGLKGESGAVQGDFFMNTDFQRAAEAIDKVSRQLENAVNAELTALKGAKKLGTAERQKILSKYGISTGDTKAIENRIGELEKFKADFDKRETNPAMMNLLRRKAGIEVEDGAEVAKDPTAANDLALESATAEELNAEEKKRREKAEIEKRKNAPLKGGAGETGQTLMDLGGVEGEDLFNRTERQKGGITFDKMFDNRESTRLYSHPEYGIGKVKFGPLGRDSLRPRVGEIEFENGKKIRLYAFEKNNDADFMSKLTPVVNDEVSKPTTPAPATPEKSSAVEKPKFDGEYGKLVDEYKAAEKRLDDSIANEKNGNIDEVARLEALNDRRAAELKLRKFEKDNRLLETFDRTPDMSLSSNEISSRIRETRNEIAIAKAEREKNAKKPSAPRKRTVVMKNAEEEAKADAALSDIEFDTNFGIISTDEKKHRSVAGLSSLRMVGAPARAFSDFVSGRIGKNLDLKSGTVISSDTVRDTFYAFEPTEAQRTLFEEVYRAAEKLGVDYVIDGKDDESPVSLGDELGGHVRFHAAKIDGERKRGIPSTILHEMIHGVTSYAIQISENQSGVEGVALPNELHNAVRRLRQVYNAHRIWIKNEYGGTNIYEFVAELSNPDFCKKLEKKGFWKWLCESIANIFKAITGGKKSSSTNGEYNKLVGIVGDFLKNADKVAFDTYRKAAEAEIHRAESSDNFDYEKFGKLVAGVGKLVDVLTASGHKDFKSLATFISERAPDKYQRAKAVLQDVWNAVARQKGLARVTDAQADEVFGIIDKETENGRTTDNEKRVDSDKGTGGDGDNADRPDEGVSAGGDESAGGLPAGGRVRPGNTDERVDGGRPRGVPGRTPAVAEGEVQEGKTSGGGKASGGNEPVADRAGHEDGRPADEGAPEEREVAAEAAGETKVNPPVGPDFVMTKAVEEAILERDPIKRAKNNLAAIRLLRKLRSESRTATPSEQEALAKYVGWGGLSQILDYSYDRAYSTEQADGKPDEYYIRKAKYGAEGYELYKEMRSMLNDEEMSAIRESTLSAFYTPVEMVRAEHDALRALGVLGGRFLGPSAGTGNYASAAGEYAKGVRWQFVELDKTTGEILKHLFPNQRVEVNGYEKTNLPDSYYDVAIDNVPYVDFNVTTDKAIPSMKLHDYFFAKTLSKLRPGGVMMFLTSTGTLDKASPTLRKYLSENGGQIVGAVRLPNGFFSKNAGTDAASDLVIVQKKDGVVDNSAFEGGRKFAETTEWVARKGKQKVDLTYNKYFAHHPDQVVGEMKAGSGQYGRPVLEYKIPKGDLFGQVREAIDRALAGIDKDALLKAATVAEVKERTPIYDDMGLRQGSVAEKDGKFMVKAGAELVPVALPSDRLTPDGKPNKGYQSINRELAKRFIDPKKMMRGLFAVRKAMRDVVDAEMRGCTDEELSPLLDVLNAEYDGFVKKFGTLNSKHVVPFVMLDTADGNRMMALERTAKENGQDKVLKSDIFKKRVIFKSQRPTRAGTPMEAMIIGYSEAGFLNPTRVAELLDCTYDEAVQKLKATGAVFENPQTGKLEPSWQYLSGRVRTKLAAARAAAEQDAAYAPNVKALEGVIPKDVNIHDVKIPFNASWTTPEVMADFIRDAFGAGNINVKFTLNKDSGLWFADYGRSRLEFAENPWGETSWRVDEFILRVLNNETMEHWNSYKIGDETVREFDREGTEKNKLAKERLNRAFESFVQNSEKWHDEMERRYNDTMNDQVPLSLPPGILPFEAAGMKNDSILKLFEKAEDGKPDMKRPKKGREYQSNVIAIGVLGGQNLYLAHAVGAGKTMEMQAISMLGRHLGQFKKPIHVVPNHMLEQYCNEWLADFPDANILKMTDEDVKPENRRRFFAMAANGDWDAIVVRRDTFAKKLSMSEEYQREYYDRLLDEYELAVMAATEANGKGDSTVKELEKRFKKLREKVEKKMKALAEKKDKQIVKFEELGVDQIFVDEAHNFKGLPVATNQGRVKGLSQGDSSRAEDMEMKCDYIQSVRGGEVGVVFASGTSLSNAPVIEAYVVLRYLAKRKLEEQGLEHFDQFVSQFGTIETIDKVSIGGNDTKESQEVTGIQNAPEMMRLFRSVVNIVNSEQLDLPRPTKKLIPVKVNLTPMQRTVMHMVARECMISGGKEDKGKMMKLANIAKSVCISPRLLGVDEDGAKLGELARRVKEIYDDTSKDSGTQLVFTDKFNISEEATIAGMRSYMNSQELNDIKWHVNKNFDFNHAIVDALVAQGIPREEIAVMQDIDKMKGDKDQNKGELFKKVKSGKVRVLIGSRPRMGEGTNVQDRLAAIHLMHPGWKPAEDEQAQGRIIRWGNMYKEGKVFYYLTQGDESVVDDRYKEKIGSYETSNFELIGKKSVLINNIMRGDESQRNVSLNSEEDEADLLMGMTIGNPAQAELIKMRKPLHKLELDVSDLMTQARRKRDQANYNEEKLKKEEADFDSEKGRIEKWIEKQGDKPFSVETPDVPFDKMNKLADYINGKISEQLAKDKYDREDFTVGTLNGSPLEVQFPYGENFVKIGFPELGQWKEVTFDGFVSNLTMQGLSVFYSRDVKGYATPEYIERKKAQFASYRSQIAKMRETADAFEKEYKEKGKLLASEKRRQLELQRQVYPLVVKTTDTHGFSAYGNWVIRKRSDGFVAQRMGTDKTVMAKTVREIIPLIDAEDIGDPSAAAKETADLAKFLERNRITDEGDVKTMPASEVQFDTDIGDTHDIVQDGKTVFTGRFRTDRQADGYARHFYGEGAKAVRRDEVQFDTELLAPENDRGGFDDDEIRNAANEAGRKYVRLGAAIAGGAGGAQREGLGGKAARLSAREVLAAVRSDERYFGGLEKAREDISHEPFPDGVLEKGGQESPLVMRTGESVVKFRSASAPDFEFQKVGWHNMFFGDAAKMPHMVETPYELKGFAADKKEREGELFAILEQPFVNMVPNSGKEARYLLLQDLRKRFGEVKKLGEREIEVDGWVIDDLKDVNIAMVKGAKKYAVVDCFIHRKHELPRYADETGGEVSFDTRITPAEDAAYMDAVKRGDMETAARMVREAAAKAMPNTKVVDEDGFPRELSVALDEVRKNLRMAVFVSRGKMPEEVARIVANWNVVSKSPYSQSYYNTDGITWDRKPEGSLRVANHWNFWSRGEEHCKTDIPVVSRSRDWGVSNYLEGGARETQNYQWALGEYHNGVYHILKTWDVSETFGEFSDENNIIARQLSQAESEYVEAAAKSLVGKKINLGYRGVIEVEDSHPRAKTAKVLRLEKDSDGYLDCVIKVANDEYTMPASVVVEENDVLHSTFHGELRQGAVDKKVFADTENGIIKSADPVTYDDAGNVIPLSERFNPQNEDIRWDTKDLTPEESAYAEREDKTLDEKDMREVLGLTNAEIATAMRADGLEPKGRVRKPDSVKYQQAQILLSNPSYMAKLARARARVGIPLRDYEVDALGQLFWQRKDAVNERREEYNAILSIPEDERTDEDKANLVTARKALDEALRLEQEAGGAKTAGASELGRGLRANRDVLDAHDHSFAGIAGKVQAVLGKNREIPTEMRDAIDKIVKDYEDADDDAKAIMASRLKAASENGWFNDTKKTLKLRKAGERKVGDEEKLVTRNYLDALAQIETQADRTGGSLVGMSDQMYPSWGKYLKAIGTYHVFMNPEMAEDEVVAKIVEDVKPFLDGIDENQVRDAVTGFGHNYRQSRYESQRAFNDLKAQMLKKRQLDYMNENNELPPQTGMIRDEPSDETRRLAREVQERKKETPEGGANRLKGILESAKTRVKNRIADLERAIMNGEAIPRRERTVREDVELINLKKRRDELQEQYDAIFGTKSGMTDEQRVKATERALAKELERTMEDLARAKAGDFSKRPKRPGVSSATIESLREEIERRRQEILDLKNANYEFGLTPAEIAERNARKIQAREAALMRMAERIEKGDVRPMKKRQPPMTADEQKRYDALGKALKDAQAKMAALREQAAEATRPGWVQKGRHAVGTALAAQRLFLATLDLSAFGKQGAAFWKAHPELAARAMKTALSATKDDARMAEIRDELMSDPDVQEAVSKFGLHLRETASKEDVEMFKDLRELTIAGKGVSDIPILGNLMLKSERHYITYLNAISVAMYTSIINDKTRFPGGATNWQKQQICDLVNMYNGSGAMSKKRRQNLNSGLIGKLYWAPGLLASRLQSVALYDVWHPLVTKGYQNAEGEWEVPTTKERLAMTRLALRERMRTSAATVALGVLFLALKSMFDEGDELDKFKRARFLGKTAMLMAPTFFNTTLDFSGGSAQYVRLLDEIISGERTTGTGRTQELGSYGVPSASDLVLKRLVRYKVSPFVGLILNMIIDRRQLNGEKYGFWPAMRDMLVPLSIQDIYDQAKENPLGALPFTAAATLLGIAGQTYDRRPYENAVNPFLDAKKEYDAIAADETITDEERKAKLSQMRENNPLLRDEVREDIAADLAAIRKDENRAKRMEKNGEEPDAELNDQIEQAKREVLEKIRASR